MKIDLTLQQREIWLIFCYCTKTLPGANASQVYCVLGTIMDPPKSEMFSHSLALVCAVWAALSWLQYRSPRMTCAVWSSPIMTLQYRSPRTACAIVLRNEWSFSNPAVCPLLVLNSDRLTSQLVSRVNLRPFMFLNVFRSIHFVVYICWAFVLSP